MAAVGVTLGSMLGSFPFTTPPIIPLAPSPPEAPEAATPPAASPAASGDAAVLPLRVPEPPDASIVTYAGSGGSAPIAGLAGGEAPGEEHAAGILRAYPKLQPTFAAELVALAHRLGAHPYDIAELIRNESGFNPAAVNPASGATGLIQFMPRTALSLGTTVQHLRTLSAVEQLRWVEAYLRRVGPPYDRKGLILGVFYPAARSWPLDRRFPDVVIKANPGLNTPGDAIARVARRARLWGTAPGGAASAGGCEARGIDPCVRPRPE